MLEMADRVQRRLIGASAEPVVAVNPSRLICSLIWLGIFKAGPKRARICQPVRRKKTNPPTDHNGFRVRSPWAVKVTARNAKATTRLPGTHPSEAPVERGMRMLISLPSAREEMR